MVLCNCCIKYGGVGRINTPFKKHLWNCMINDDREYEIDWNQAVQTVMIIEKFYIRYKEIRCRNRTQIYKEELIMTVFSPKRLERHLQNGWDLDDF